MSWAEAVWLRKKTEQAKRLVGSNSSFVKGFSTVELPASSSAPPVVIGSFIPKYSGSVTIISELWNTGSEAGNDSQYRLLMDGTDIYNATVSFPYSTKPHNIIYTTINVTAGQEYILSARTDEYNYYSRCAVSVGASLSESDLVE